MRPGEPVTKEAAKEFAKSYVEKNTPLLTVKVLRKQMPNFYMGLYAEGVNMVIFHEGDQTRRIELEQIFPKPDMEKMNKQHLPVLNPGVQLTVVYFLQELRKPNQRRDDAERMQKLTAIKFSDLPLEYAIKQVRGDGKRVFASFEDPNCGYCKKLAKDIAKLNNVTIYTFLLPILSPDSLEKSNQIWCAADKAKAWNDYMRENKAPAPAKSGCDTTAIQKTMELGRRLNITGTPTIFFANGERVPGAVPAAMIEQKLGLATEK